MKKLLALMLAVACLFALTSCGGLSEDDAREVAEKFMNAYMEMDADTIKKLADDKDELPEEILDFKGWDAEKEEIMENLPAELSGYTKDMEKIVDTVIDKALDAMDYKITKVKEVEGGFEVSVEINAINGAMGDSFGEILTDSMDQSAMMQLVTKLMQEGKISVTSSQEDMMKVLMPEIIKIIGDAVEKIEFEIETKDVVLFVYENEDGEILINVDKSSLDD